MSKFLETGYTFDASAKTVVFTGYTSGSLQQKMLLLITNVVDGLIIYNTYDAAKGGTITPDAGGDILTLEFDTTSMSDTDELQIFMEDGNFAPSGQDILDSLTELTGINSTLNTITNQLPSTIGQGLKIDSLSVALASDQDALPITDNGGSITVDGTVTANAGTNLNTSALALETGGNLDDIKTAVESVDTKTPALGQALAAASVPVVLPAAQITTLTPPSAVQANAGTNLNTSALALESGGNLAAIKTAVETIDNFISGTKGLVTEDNSAAIKTAVETIDNFISGSRGLVTEDNSAAIKTSVELLDDAVIADNAQFTDGTTKLHMKGFIYDEVAGTALTENDAAAARINANRAQVGALEDGTTRGRYATVTAANALKVDASGVAVPVTDNSGSLTVDAPVGTPVFATLTPSTTGGWDTFMASSSDGSTALTNSAQAIKGSAGTFGGYYIYNPNSSAVYVHIYDVASGSVTVGTTNPKNTFCIPATSGANLEITNGIKYSTAMSCAATTTGGGNTAPSTALEANFFYK